MEDDARGPLHLLAPQSIDQEANALHHGSLRRSKRLRHDLVAEAFGSAMIIVFGSGSVAAAGVGAYGTSDADPFAKSLYINATWAIGVAFGIMVSFNTSGAVLNPALQLNAMIQGNFAVGKSLQFMLAQTLGFFLGAVLMTMNFIVFKGEHQLRNFYCTAPGDGVSFLSAGVNEFIGTAILTICVSAITNNHPAFDKFQLAGSVALCILGIGNVFGPLSGYALNPARDFGPRMCYLLFALLYGSVDIWVDVMGQGYFLVPIIATSLGAVFGGMLYRRLIFLEE